ncbi:MAG TPA: hypothetical protein VG759_03490, partial [Candidatus Angelobacter sp.]|nr:hypothetical protein [Candidatus Angelobacter sp.]
LDNRCAEAYALVLLFESGYADQNDLARCFGYSTRTLRRFQKHLQSAGLNDLARAAGRPAVSSTPPPSMTTCDQSILRLKANGMSNRWIGLISDARRRIAELIVSRSQCPAISVSPVLQEARTAGWTRVPTTRPCATAR